MIVLDRASEDESRSQCQCIHRHRFLYLPLTEFILPQKIKIGSFLFLRAFHLDTDTVSYIPKYIALDAMVLMSLVLSEQ